MTTRLRQAFKYPSEDEDDDDHIDLDEQEQEGLISNLEATNTTQNTLYIRVFTLFPLVCIPAFLIFMFSAGANRAVRTLCLLSMTSLVASAFTMWFIPYSTVESPFTGHQDLRQRRGETLASGRAKRHNKTRKVPGLDIELDDDGPLGRMIPLLNAGICLILSLSSFMVKGRDNVPQSFWWFNLIPSVVWIVVYVVRQTIGDVEEEIKELSGLKYGYKGA